MSKAEERAEKTYPAWRNGIGDEFSQNSAYYGFIEGYHQAEKDLELTWKDIPEILRISEQLKTSWWFRDNEQTKQIGTQVFWEEVLKRFKARKENYSTKD